MKDRPPHSDEFISTLVDLLFTRATGDRRSRGFTFFRGDDVEDEWLRYADLHQAAQQLEAHLTATAKDSGTASPSGTPPRAMVLCPPGPTYVKALFGTLYAGMIAVTAYPPRARRRDERLDGVVDDSRATIALVDQTIFDRRDQFLKASPRLRELQWINVDDLPPALTARTDRARIEPDALAVLQYTSGSTSDPKGVCLTHRNLLSNLRMIYEAFEIERYADQWSVTWLPPYHDMGLIGGLLQVMYAGVSSHVIPPASFVQKPIRWLRAITKYGASVSGGPNFAYDLCVDRIPHADRDSLDLSSWTLAFVGAEPVREKSLHRFADAFARSGFERTSFFPCYGLAEATLMVSGGPRRREPKVCRSLVESNTRTATESPAVVSCGRTVIDQRVCIVDPKTRARLPAGSEGEIWIAGDHVSRGYWGRSAANDDVFDQPLEGEEARFLRTGDLGYLDDGEIVVTGRLKELIIVRGRNFQPAEIESAIADCSPLLVPNGCAAFELDADGEAGLVIIQELEGDGAPERDDVAHRIRQRLVETFELEPHRVVLIPKRSLPKTSSGKVKRLETRRRYQSGELESLTIHSPPTTARTGNDRRPDVDEISSWLVHRLAKHLEIDATSIDVSRPFVQYGLDSVSAVQITSELESLVGREIPATLFYEAPTIAAAAAALRPRQVVPTELESDRATSLRATKFDFPKDIAIVGAACRMPTCAGLDEFLQLLRSGRNVIREPPPDRQQCASESATTRRAGWISDPDLFDAALFGISPREASCIDPQHRMLLETSWRAIEDAGIDPKRLAGTNTAAFVGIANRDYERLILAKQVKLSTYSMTGNAASMAAHRLSYHLDLHGPSLAIDTACSSSLVAVHQAVRAIQSGDCEAAIVAGVNLILSPEVSETLSDAEMLSPDGLCRTFDAAARGYVRGEGCIAIVLKPLADAIRHGDPIRAVIHGSAINQDGLTNGITAPSGDSQVRLYQRALADASLQASEVTLLEAHGTGTILGDPIEVRSLKEVYGAVSPDNPLCHLGAVKANVGHLEAAAGLVGLLKVVLQLQHHETVPQPNLQTINPHIDLAGSRILIPIERASWPESRRRIAAVSSFGFGGTNAHVIVGQSPLVQTDDEPVQPPRKDMGAPFLITLSATSADALKETALDHAQWIDDHPSLDIGDFAAAMQRQKTSHRHRLAILGDSAGSIRDRLTQFASCQNSPAVRAGCVRTDRELSIAFLFSGQGSQYVSMGRGLCQRSKTFRDWIGRCDELLHDEFGYRVGDVFTSDPATNGSIAKILEGPGAQTGLFVLQLALAKTLHGWGIRSSFVIGHSMGEYAAAVVAGVIDWQDALRLTAIRAQRVAELGSTGAMTVVFASVESVKRRLRDLDDRLAIAAIDGSDHVVVSGPVSSIQTLERSLQRTGTATRSLRIAHAFHSRLIDPVLEAIGTTVSGFTLNSPQLTYISTLTGTVVSEELRTADYWMRQSRQPVQFAAAIETLGTLGCDIAIEIGPHATLCALGELNTDVSLQFRPTLVRGRDDWHSISDALADVFVKGANVDWAKVHPADDRRSRVILPGHPFHRKRYWIEAPTQCDSRPQSKPALRTFGTKEVAKRIVKAREYRNAARDDKDLAPLQEAWTQYADAMRQVDQIITQFMRRTLTKLGIGLRAGDPIVPQELVAAGVVAKPHRRLLSRICEILEEDGILSRDAVIGPNREPDASNRWSVVETPPAVPADLNQQIAQLERRFPAVRYELRLVSRCGGSLAQVLRGDLEPLAVLFPGGELSDLMMLYRGSPLAKISNRLVAEAVRTVIEMQTERWPSRSGGLRVLEIGAGTGGTTSAVLPAIKDRIATYVFTDASPLLVADSSSRFGLHDGVEYQLLDIESPTSEQGFEDNSFDVVIAANVLHATSDLRTSLVNARRLLRPGGFLIALEGVRRERFLDLVFGITEGWWRFADLDLRAHYPLIEEQRWTRLLEDCGFAEPTGLPFPPGEEAARDCQTVLIAAVENAESTEPTLGGDSGPIHQAMPGHGLRRANVTPPTNTSRWIEAFRQATPDQRPGALEGYFSESVSLVLGHDPDELDLDQPVSNLGIDSLMAIQLKNRLESDLGLSIPMIAFLEGNSVRQLIRIAIEPTQELNEEASRDQPVTDLLPEHGLPAGPADSQDETERPASNAFADAGIELDPHPLSQSGDRILGPMSVGQLALWMIHQRAPRGPAYNFAFAARASGVIDRAAMTKACRSLVGRHPVLRTRYRLEGDAAVRVLSGSTDVVIDEKDCYDWKESRIVDWIRHLADQPFDLEHGPVIRFTLLRSKSGDVLSIAMHHIAADLWSMDVLVQELIDLYTVFVSGGSIQLGPLPNTYDDYVRWEQSLDRSAEGTRLWEFWRRKLDGAPQVLDLPTTFPRPPEQTFHGRSLEWTIPPEVVSTLRDVAHAERTTMFTIVLAAYQAFLSRICGQDDLLVGTVSASRGRSEWEGIVGYFLNPLVLRTRIDGSPTFRDVLRDSQREVLDALANQSFPFAKLVEQLRPARDPSRSPLVQTMFIWDKPRHLKESHFGPGKSGDRLRLRPLLMEQRGAPFDLTLIAFELEEDLKLTFRYNTNLFSHEAIETLSESLESFIEAIAADPDTLIRSTPLLAPTQEERVAAWNATDTDFDPKLSGYPLFRRWVERTPDAVAIESHRETLTYAQAESRASQIARELQRNSVSAGDTVGLLATRGVDAVVAILGIWKAGAAYLPLDPDHPPTRLQSICDDAAPRLLLTSVDTDAAQSLHVRCPIVELADCITAPHSLNEDPFPREVDPDSPAYIIYTSGSTGRPKGVVVAHRGVANLAVAQHQTFGVVQGDRCLQFASLSFDASVFELMMAFHAGASLWVIDPVVLRSTTSRIAEELRRSRVSMVTLPPTMLAAIPADSLPDLHTIISAGEACSAAIVQKWGQGRRMFNAYGPTEATVWATTERCLLDREEPTLGTPIANVRAHIMDARLQQTPVGVPGELCLAGPGLAIGYKNLPEATSEVFVPNPLGDRFDATLYRTGDRVRWTHGGKLEFLGRIDDQVKIDGHRIEPGEIASVIRQLASIQDAYVTALETGAGRQLIAYCVPASRPDANPHATTMNGAELSFGAIDESAIRKHVADRLPCYMVPKQFIPVARFPLTVNGKIDARQLPLPKNVQAAAGQTLSAPSSETESAIVAVWREVLHLEALGVHDNFFDLGGASLQALQAADLATRRGYAISAEQMFQFQTVALLAREIDASVAACDVGSVAEPAIPAPGASSPTPIASTDSRANASETRGQPAHSQDLRMVVESIGMYLPPDTLSTEEVVRGCRNRLDFPLERMTGITSRHVAGNEEFSIDLARKAALDCLQHSRFDAADIDLLIASNISRYDAPNFGISFEPSTASKLKAQIGATSALAFDVCNACAGFFTALAVAESKLLAGESRCAMIVSGEYITHLTKTAQLEIDGFLDPRLACLTLGDAGIAVIVELTDNGFGFETLDLYTAGRHHELCVAKATDRPHGGAIMLTDAIKASAVTLDHSVAHANHVLATHHWNADEVRHVIMHQTSTTTLDGAIEELNRRFGRPVCSHENTVNNLQLRGNTASTTHWVAVMDMIRQGRIQPGDRTVFAISGSGQTIGTALYRFDTLPDRLRDPRDLAVAPSGSRLLKVGNPKPYGVRIVSATVDRNHQRSAATRPHFSERLVVESAACAASVCLRSARWNPDDVELLIHTGIYRDDFLSEPAVAAILAGVLEINENCPANSARRTLAFDLSDGERGTMTACSLLATMIRSGRVRRGLITASEVAINAEGAGRGIAQLGSAIALEQIDDCDQGLGEFFFRSYPDHAADLSVSTTLRNGKPTLVVRCSDDLAPILIRCVCDCVSKFLASTGAESSRYDRILLSVPTSVKRSTIAKALNVPIDQVAIAELPDQDPFTSGLALLWESLASSGSIQPGAKWLLVAAGAGIEVGCVEYQH